MHGTRSELKVANFIRLLVDKAIHTSRAALAIGHDVATVEMRDAMNDVEYYGSNGSIVVDQMLEGASFDSEEEENGYFDDVEVPKIKKLPTS